MRITVPKGTQGIWTNAVLRGSGANYFVKNEFILKPGTRFRITGVKGVKTAGFTSGIMVDAEVVP
jgi:hypothetical protein